VAVFSNKIIKKVNSSMTTPAIPMINKKKKKQAVSVNDALLNPVAYRKEPKVSPPYREISIRERMGQRGWH